MSVALETVRINIDHCFHKRTETLIQGFSPFLVSAFRQLSEAKQKTTRYAGGNKKLYKKSPFKYNKGVQAYCKKKGEMYGKPNT